MAVITLTDWARRVDPDGKTPTIVEILNETNEILDDMAWVEGNLPTGHRTTIRSGLPSVAWRLLNYGVQPSKSTTVPVTDSCGMLEAYSEIDKSIADLNGNTASFRLSEDVAFIESMSQELAKTIFKGDTVTDPEKFLGLEARFSQKSGAPNSDNIIDAGGTGTACTSVWLIVWDSSTIHGIFPKGSKAGLTHEDLGQVTLTDAGGGRYEGYRSHYKWDAGLTLRDWRYVVRICNLTASNLAIGSTFALEDYMVEATERIPSLSRGRAAFYCNRSVRAHLRRRILSKGNVNLTIDSAGGKPILRFAEIPVRRADVLKFTETAL
jgi:hypothetical protein